MVGNKYLVTSVYGNEIGGMTYGPFGSAACSAVNRRRAIELTTGLTRMQHSCNIALEIGWTMGLSIWTT